MLTKPKLIVPFQIGRPGDFAFCGFRLFVCADLRRAISSHRVNGLGFLVAHAFCRLGLTLTVRPCSSLVSPMSRVGRFFLFRLLRLIQSYPRAEFFALPICLFP